MNQQNIDLEQPVELERGKSTESDFGQGDLENLELYKLHKNVINQLLQMGYSLRAALLCVQITKSSDIVVNTHFALMNEHGEYIHPFLEKGKKKLCIICNDVQSKHNREANPKFFEKDRKKDSRTSKGTVDRIGPKLGSNPHDVRKNGGAVKNSNATWNSKLSKIKAPEPIPKALKDPVTCTVCYEQVERDDIIKYDNTPHDICKPCFIEYLTTQINHNKVTKIICPHCSQELQETTIKQIVPPELYEKYHKFLKNIKVNSDPLCKWCPNPKCSEVITLEKENTEKGKCEHCGLEICGKCGQKYHGTSISCEKYMATELKKWKLDHDSAACPKCKMIVEKDAGCNHMSCPVCLYEWCWICGSGYTPYHFMNPFGCIGLQDGDNTKKKWARGKRYLRRLFIILALPFILIFGIPCYLSIKLSDITCGSNHPVLGAILLIPTFLFGLVLSVLFIAFLPLIALGYLINYCTARLKLRQRSKRRLREIKRKAQNQKTIRTQSIKSTWLKAATHCNKLF